MLDQREQRPFAGIQRHDVDEVEQTRLGEFTQLGVDETAAERDDHLRMPRLHRLGDAQRRIHRPRERHRQQEQRGAMPIDGRECERGQAFVHQVGRGSERFGQRIETGLAGRQLLGVAHELEPAVDSIAQHVGEVVEVERREMARAILQAERAERPGERVAAVVVDIHVERAEARTLGEPVPADDAVRERRVVSLQEADRGADRRVVTLELGEEMRHGRGSSCFGQRLGTGAHLLEPRRREQVEHKRERQVFLHRRDAARPQEAGQVGRRRVRRVELRHRRDDGQHSGIAGRGHTTTGSGSRRIPKRP